MDGPSRRPTDSSLRSGTPSLSEVPSGGARALWLLWGFSKVTRCKSGTHSGRYSNNGYTPTPPLQPLTPPNQIISLTRNRTRRIRPNPQRGSNLRQAPQTKRLPPRNVRPLQRLQRIPPINTRLIHQNQRQRFTRLVNVLRRTYPPHRRCTQRKPLQIRI